MNKEILRLAIPNIISNISVPLLSTVDTALMGRLSAQHIGAVGVGAMVFNFIYWNFGFLRMGTTGLTAQAFGATDSSRATTILGRAVLIVLVIGGILLVVQQIIGDAAIFLMGITGEQKNLVYDYFMIRIWAAPATLMSYALLGWFFGLQNSIFPMILVISVNVVNILLSYYLVQIRAMDIAGVAYGTVVAQYVGLVLGLIMFYYKYHRYLNYWDIRRILQLDQMVEFLKFNGDIFFRTLLLTTAFAFFYSQSAKEGALILAVNVILLQFLSWMSYGVDGFAFASESLVGKYFGKEDYERTYEAIRLSFYWGLGVAVIFSVLYATSSGFFIKVFTDQIDVIQAADPFYFWMVLFPLLSTPCYIWDGIFIGLTASKAMRNSMIVAFGVYLITYFVLENTGLGNYGLLLAFLAFMMARGLVQWWYFLNYRLNLT